MTAKQFRRMAHSLPEVEERAHMAHPDFRDGGRFSPPSVTRTKSGEWSSSRYFFGTQAKAAQAVFKTWHLEKSKPLRASVWKTIFSGVIESTSNLVVR